jgi:hypothetical protein
LDTAQNVRLTSAETATLWTTYINDTMAKCVLTYFMNKAEDAEIQKAIEYAYRITIDHIERLTKLFIAEDFPVPQGFTDEDVNVNANRLFSDSFFMYYLKNMAKVGIVNHGAAYSMASRSDVRKLFNDCLMDAASLDEKITEVMQQKGIYVRPPCISNPAEIDFVTNKNFISGGLFGLKDTRPLLSIEIAQLFANVNTNALGKALLIGFSQVVRSNEIRQYLITGKEISSKHIKIFSDILTSEDIPTPMVWDNEVMDSREAPFSDKLILFHVSVLVAAGTANYGVSAAASPRKDLAASYVRLAAEVASYAENGALLLIKNRWLEEPPQAPDRDALASPAKGYN